VIHSYPLRVVFFAIDIYFSGPDIEPLRICTKHKPVSSRKLATPRKVVFSDAKAFVINC